MMNHPLNCMTLACVAALASTSAAYAHSPVSDEEIEKVIVHGRYDNSLGSSDAASQGTIRAELLKNRPAQRPGEVLEYVPGMVVTQHSGDGKANQYFLRGFNLDHGTDFSTRVNGVPVNMPSHAHGQGYSDLNFLIPELVDRIDYRKGPYFATDGDFSAAGSANIIYRKQLSATASLELGQNGYARVFAGFSSQTEGGLKLLRAIEFAHNNGPWTVKENFRKSSSVFTLSEGTSAKGWQISLMNYAAKWTAPDQIPERIIGQSYSGRTFNRFDSLDDSSGGNTRRTSASGQWQRSGQGTRDEVSVYALHYALDLHSNFTYFTNGVAGDQFYQRDNRNVLGGQASRTMMHRFLGSESSAQWGLQVRKDRIQLGLFDTTRRQITSITREDQVAQIQTGAFVENATQWQPKFRSVLGLRWDQLNAEVNSLSQAANSGRSRSALLSPKLALIAGPFAKTEFFYNAGRGFHSNDARGTTLRIDPKTGLPADQVRGLSPSVGSEWGLRTEVIPGLQSSWALWRHHAASELSYVGDAGNTEPGQASRRRGIESNHRYTPNRLWIMDADFSWSRARFANGERIDNAVDKMAALSATYKNNAWAITFATRYIGSAALQADNSVRSQPSITSNLRLVYKANSRWECKLDILNLFNRQNSDIQYVYTSQLPQESNPIQDRHIHPAEQRNYRISLKADF